MDFRGGCNAPVKGKVFYQSPFAVDLSDLGDRRAVRHRFDAEALGRRGVHAELTVFDLDDAGKHQMRIGVFVIDEQHAVR